MDNRACFKHNFGMELRNGGKVQMPNSQEK